jgi:hypothetical protein
VYLCDGVHQVSRANFYIDLTLDELVRVRNPLRLFWPEWRLPDLGPGEADDLDGPEADLAGRRGRRHPLGDFGATRGEGALGSRQ